VDERGVASTPRRRPDPPEHAAEALTEGGREARIRFNGQVYTLRITRQGKLLLTK
jgi:hemin uptake protein HemP